MWKDPIVEEVRRVRREIEAECRKAGKTYSDHLRDFQKNYEARLVTGKPRAALSVSPR
jgi:hypothetical protein